MSNIIPIRKNAKWDPMNKKPNLLLPSEYIPKYMWRNPAFWPYILEIIEYEKVLGREHYQI